MVSVLVGMSSASAQQLDPRETQARKDCLIGKYESGVSLLTDLFAETGNNNFIYNQARCYEQNARPEEAINRFREYLRVAKEISPTDRADVESHIAECRRLQEEERKATSSTALAQAALPAPTSQGPAAVVSDSSAPLSAPTPPVPVGAPSGTSAPLGPAATATSEIARQEQPRSAGGSGLRIAGAVLGAGGVAGVLTGAVFGMLVWNTKQKVETEASQQHIYDAGLDSRGRSYETWQWACYGVGAGLLVAGGTIYYIGRSAGVNGPAASLALVPSIAPGKGGIALQGSF
jgi:hypothetical protein